ncbi:hypothetical protein [Marinimicrobium sp. LS-A18]|uniref:hypothetical protein n=1 Tax=Marinimicrobium sp. LS-A18 TaxID=1381596 RepID=UPI0012679363|nr:hypothetical protein [Marinimicrobium sp. LS-A18]
MKAHDQKPKLAAFWLLLTENLRRCEADKKIMECPMSESDIVRLKSRVQPIFDTVLECHYTGEFNAISRIFPSLSSEVFDEAVGVLKPMGRPARVEFLGAINKVSEIKLLWKVSYHSSDEELLWELLIDGRSDELKFVGLGFDK